MIIGAKFATGKEAKAGFINHYYLAKEWLEYVITSYSIHYTKLYERHIVTRTVGAQQNQ